MSHPRIAIRNKVKEILLDASITKVGINIDINRMIPLSVKEIPKILIYTNSEVVNNKEVIGGIPGLPDDVTGKLIIELIDDIRLRVEDSSDDILFAIQMAMSNNIKLDGLVKDCLYQGMDRVMVQEGNIKLLSSTLNFDFRYSYLTLSP